MNLKILNFLFFIVLAIMFNDVENTTEIVWTKKESNVAQYARDSPSSGVSYQEFLINEFSYKFWAVFQLVTVIVLLYSTFAAIYYARYNYLMNLESGDYEDLLFARSLITNASNIDISTFERIVEAIFGIND